MKIELGKKYLTRSGNVVEITRIIGTDYCRDYPFGGYFNGVLRWFTENGKYSIHGCNSLDLIEEYKEEEKMDEVIYIEEVPSFVDMAEVHNELTSAISCINAIFEPNADIANRASDIICTIENALQLAKETLTRKE